MAAIDPLLSALPFVGRATELASLEAAMEAATKGGGSTIILAGESGIGKTRLTEAAMASAEKRGFSVALGRAYPVETSVPYAPFADALTPVLRRLDKGAVELLSRGGTRELAYLFPGFAADTRAAGPIAEPAELKARLLWTFAQFLTRFAAKQPLLLVLENLQWADPSSLELLHFVARQLSGTRAVLLCTYNQAQRDENPALRTTEDSLVALGAARVVRLQPLERAAVDELLHRVFRVEPTAIREFAALLFGWTRGNPFFLGETLKSLVQSGRLHEQDGVWHGWEMQGLELPRTIRDALIARVDRLTSVARSVADISAVIGTRATWDGLRAVTTLGRPELLAALDELRRAQILVEGTVASQVVYDFSHPLLRDTIYNELGRPRAQQVHATVAEALERHYADAAAAHADELAFHFAEAGADDLADKAARYLTAAGRGALARHANREALTYLSAAVEQSRRPGVAPDLALLSDLARARQRAGDHDGALATWAQVRDRADALGDVSHLAAAEGRLGMICFWRGQLPTSIAHLDAGLAAAARAGSDRLTAHLLVTKSLCLQQMGSTDDARAAVTRALAAAEQSGDPATLSRVHRTAVLLHVWTGASELGRESAARALDLARATGDRAVAWSAHWGLAVLSALTGKVRETRTHLVDAQHVAEELHSPLMQLWCDEIALQYAFAIGDWRTAATIAERSIALARALNVGALLPRLLVWAANLYLSRGDIERGKQYADEAWALSGAGTAKEKWVDVHTVVPAHLGMATYHLVLHEYDKALEFAERGLAIADRVGYATWAIYRLLPVIIECYIWKRDFPRARAMCTRLQEDADRVGHALGVAWAEAGTAFTVMLSSGTTLPLVRRVADALDLVEAIPYVFDAARGRREIATRYIELGDIDSAGQELRRAHDVFAQLGADLELNATREQMRGFGIRPPVRASTPGVEGLTGREIEIIGLISKRKSNKEIGKVLGISPRTVSTHLSNIFGKLGVASRGELTDIARHRELLGGAPQ